MDGIIGQLCDGSVKLGPGEAVVVMGVVMTVLRGLTASLNKVAEKTEATWDNRLAAFLVKVLRLLSWASGFFSAGALKAAPLPPLTVSSSEKKP